MRRAARVDANQGAIVAALRAAGASVAITSSLGSGFPDLVVGLRGRTVLLEVKDGAKPPSARKLTPDEAKFHAQWKGEVFVVETVDQAIRAVTWPRVQCHTCRESFTMPPVVAPHVGDAYCGRCLMVQRQGATAIRGR